MSKAIYLNIPAHGPEGASVERQAQQLGDSLRNAGGSATAAEEILAFVTQHSRIKS